MSYPQVQRDAGRSQVTVRQAHPPYVVEGTVLLEPRHNRLAGREKIVLPERKLGVVVGSYRSWEV